LVDFELSQRNAPGARALLLELTTDRPDLSARLALRRDRGAPPSSILRA